MEQQNKNLAGTNIYDHWSFDMPLFKKNRKITPAQIIILGFMALILTGALLLTLPCASRGDGGAPFLDALFTATSATCVTGLVVYDTYQYWTGFGQTVILLLIQIGGMGVVTMAVAIFRFTGRRISLKQRWVMQESISAPQVGGIVRMTGFILKSMFLIEAIGAALLAIRFIPQFGPLRGLWYSVFHSISAFCNAGIDLMGEETAFSSLTSYVGDPLVSGVVAMLIVTGGIGFLTWHDIRTHKYHFKRYRLQSKLVLCTTAILLVASYVFFLVYEFGLPQWKGLTAGERVTAAMFQAVTPRTAGFNTVDLTALSQPAQLFTILLMLTGGAPASTAGGFKVSTLAVLLLSVRAVYRNKESAQCFGRRFPTDTLRSASAIFVMYIALFLAGGMLICCIEGIPLMNALFEAASAIGTVGLSLGSTPELCAVSKIILIALMYFGRVGGLTLIYAMSTSTSSAVSQYPQESVTVG